MSKNVSVLLFEVNCIIILLYNNMDNVQLKNRAIILREEGYSYSEIERALFIPKSTLSYWLKGISLNSDQIIGLKKRNLEKGSRGRFSNSINLKVRKVHREQVAHSRAKHEFDKMINPVHAHYPFTTVISDTRLNNLFVTGISLYLAHGGKTGGYFQFMSSDHQILGIMIDWIEVFFNIDRKSIKYRLIIHESYKDQDIEGYWINVLGINKENMQKSIFTSKGVERNKRPAYKGSIGVVITNIEVFRRVMAWQNLLIKYYKGVSDGESKLLP